MRLLGPLFVFILMAAIKFKNFDWILFFSVIFLCFIGLAAIYSVALSKSEPDFFNFEKQIAGLIIGVIFIFIISASNYRLLKNYRRLIYLIGLLLLVGVLLFGQTIRGTTGWFNIGPLNFQPVEIAKICLIVITANYLSERSGLHFNFPQLASLSFLGGLYVGLVILQPDLGSAAVLLFAWLGLLLFANIRKRYFIVLFLIFAVLATGVWFVGLKDYQKERILTFIDQSRDPLGQGYNVTQSVIAIGSGGLLGRGLGFGSQSQLKFLPESQTDFIFAVVAEELGLVGVGIILALFSVVFWRLFKIARRLHDDFSLFLILGISLVIFIQVGMNIAMNIGIFPVAGITLPFLSYGATSLIAFLILIGIAESIATHETSFQVYEKDKV